MNDHDSVAPDGEIENLSTAECWQLLEENSLGRLAVEGTDGIPDVFPVNYLVHSGSVFIRTAPGAKLLDVTTRPAAAFEVDGSTPAFRWSVVIRGAAQRLVEAADIHASGVLDLVSWNPTEKQSFLRVTPTTVTGRRFRRRLPDVRTHMTTPVGGTRAVGGSTQGSAQATGQGSDKPIPIPHYAPHPEG